MSVSNLTASSHRRPADVSPSLMTVRRDLLTPSGNPTHSAPGRQNTQRLMQQIHHRVPCHRPSQVSCFCRLECEILRRTVLSQTVMQPVRGFVRCLVPAGLNQLCCSAASPAKYLWWHRADGVIKLQSVIWHCSQRGDGGLPGFRQKAQTPTY